MEYDSSFLFLVFIDLTCLQDEFYLTLQQYLMPLSSCIVFKTAMEKSSGTLGQMIVTGLTYRPDQNWSPVLYQCARQPQSLLCMQLVGPARGGGGCAGGTQDQSREPHAACTPDFLSHVQHQIQFTHCEQCTPHAGFMCHMHSMPSEAGMCCIWHVSWTGYAYSMGLP